LKYDGRSSSNLLPQDKIPDGWCKKALGDLVTFQRGYDLPLKDIEPGEYPVVTSHGIAGFHHNYKATGPGIVIGRSGNLGDPQFITYPYYWPHNTTLFSKEFHNSYPLFVFYLLKSMNLKGYNSGSAVPTLNRNYIHAIETLVPENLEEQIHIAKILAAFDSKIELNKQMNKNLESIAQALFHHWFIDFEFPDENGQPYKSSGGKMINSEWGSIPEGWKYSNLKSVLSKLESGSRPKGGAVTFGIPSIGAENINGLGNYNYSSTKYVPVEYFKEMKSGKVLNFDVLLYKDGANIGRKSMFALGFPFDELCVNEHVFILRSNEILNQYYLYFWLDLANITETIVKLNANSAQPGINRQGIGSIPILVPDNKLAGKFRIIVDPLMKSIFLNSKESHTISNIRDILLPKLMSGKIRVPMEDANE